MLQTKKQKENEDLNQNEYQDERLALKTQRARILAELKKLETQLVESDPEPAVSDDVKPSEELEESSTAASKSKVPLDADGDQSQVVEDFEHDKPPTMKVSNVQSPKAAATPPSSLLEKANESNVVEAEGGRGGCTTASGKYYRYTGSDGYCYDCKTNDGYLHQYLGTDGYCYDCMTSDGKLHSYKGADGNCYDCKTTDGSLWRYEGTDGNCYNCKTGSGGLFKYLGTDGYCYSCKGSNGRLYTHDCGDSCSNSECDHDHDDYEVTY